MSKRKLRWLGLALVATAGAGVVGLSAMINPASAHADDSNIGLVIGGTTVPIPGPNYVGAADELYLNNQASATPLYPDLTFYQATPTNPFGNGLFTPEGAYPLFGQGVQQLFYNYPLNADGFPSLSTSVGQGAAILDVENPLGHQGAVGEQDGVAALYVGRGAEGAAAAAVAVGAGEREGAAEQVGTAGQGPGGEVAEAGI